MAPSRTQRRGVGILLVVILAFIVVLSIIGIAQRYLTSAVTSHTMRSSMGDLSLDLAESLVEEAISQVRRNANDPATAMFAQFRKDVYAGESGGLDLTPFIKPKETERILKDPLFAKFGIKELKAELVHQRQFEDLPYERFGLMKVRGRVQADLSMTESIVREVEVGVGLKIVLVAPPRPFDQATVMVYVSDTQTSLNYGDINTKKREYTGLVRDLQEMAEKYATGPSTPDGMRADYQQIKNSIQTSDYWQQKLTDLPTDRAVVFAAKGNGGTVSFEDLSIWKKIEDKDKTDLQPARRALDRAVQELNANQTSVQAHRNAVAALKQTAEALNGLLKIMQDYRDVFRVWGDADYETLDRFRYKLRVDHWNNKPFYVITENNPEPIDAQLRRILSTVRPLNGVIRVENPNNQLNLDERLPNQGNIQGKLVIVVVGDGKGKCGGVRVSNLNVRERANDLVTVLCVNGTLSVENEVHAALISSEGRLSVKPGAAVHGLVVADRLPSAGDRQFTVTRMDKYYSGITKASDASGAFTDYYYVGVSPHVVYKKVSRK